MKATSVGETYEEEHELEFLPDYERIVEERVFETLVHYMKKLQNGIVGHVQGAVNAFKHYYSINPRVSVTVEGGFPSLRIVVDVEIPPEEVDRIRNTVRRQLTERRELTNLRLRALIKLISGELASSTGEIGALLPGVHTAPPEGYDKAGGAGAKVRPEEGGHRAEGSNEGTLRGGEVT